MNPFHLLKRPTFRGLLSLLKKPICWAFLSGALLSFAFAPFHLPGLAFVSLALLFQQLMSISGIKGHAGRKQAFHIGFTYGLGFFGFGISWVFVSIHEYGHLNVILSAFITCLFVTYLALYLGAMAYLFHLAQSVRSHFRNGLLFSALWCLTEYARATFLTGFPWLLLGFSQVDTPLNQLLPVIGLYGVGFLTCLAASLLVISIQGSAFKRLPWLAAGIGIILMPLSLKAVSWTTTAPQATPLSVGIIQANLSMRDKWDESLFWSMVDYYRQKLHELMPTKQIIVMPESAIPAPAHYVSDFLNTLHHEAEQSNTSILMGIPLELARNNYYNAIIAMGSGHGAYKKRHLVPFGEYIPKFFRAPIDWLNIPLANISPGRAHQRPIEVNQHPIASLICYELAYPALLRSQLPEAEWIVSVSDDGWFGHSYAMYQQQQMAQALSLLTHRYQVMANNDGLSSIINTQGKIVSALPAYQAKLLSGFITPQTGATPWVTWGDSPVLLLLATIVLISLLRRLIPVQYLNANHPLSQKRSALTDC